MPSTIHQPLRLFRRKHEVLIREARQRLVGREHGSKTIKRRGVPRGPGQA